jgi:hypothetical protein
MGAYHVKNRKFALVIPRGFHETFIFYLNRNRVVGWHDWLRSRSGHTCAIASIGAWQDVGFGHERQYHHRIRRCQPQ